VASCSVKTLLLYLHAKQAATQQINNQVTNVKALRLHHRSEMTPFVFEHSNRLAKRRCGGDRQSAFRRAPISLAADMPAIGCLP
jgi:hypothetical protein